MSVRKFIAGSWQDINVPKRYAGGAWQECESVKRYSGSAWQAAWENYLGDFYWSAADYKPNHALRVTSWGTNHIAFTWPPYGKSGGTTWFYVNPPSAFTQLDVQFDWSVVSDLAFMAGSNPIYMCDKIIPKWRINGYPASSGYSYISQPSWPGNGVSHLSGHAACVRSGVNSGYFGFGLTLGSLTVSLMDSNATVRLLLENFMINGKKCRFPETLG